MGLKDLLEMILLCAQCKRCYLSDDSYLPVCPSTEKFLFEAYRPSGKAAIAKALSEGKMKINESIAKIIYACPVCGACTQQCLFRGTSRGGYDCVRVFEALREEAVKAGVGPLPPHKKYAESIKKLHNPYNELHEERTLWLKETACKTSLTKPEMTYFVGCTSSYRQKNIAKVTFEILTKIGVNFSNMASDEWCCGSPALRVGVKDLVKELAEHNVGVIDNTGVETVVFSCAGCYRTFKQDYPNLVGKLGFEPLHIAEFLSRQISEGKVKGLKEVKKIIAYHDPCHLGRHSEVYDAPRDVLKNIPCITLIEMPRNRKNAWCCGAGGGVKSGFPEWSVEVATERVKEAESLNVDALVSACPFCYRNFLDAIEAMGSRIELYDITEVLAKALL